MLWRSETPTPYCPGLAPGFIGRDIDDWVYTLEEITVLLEKDGKPAR
jgi:hypothetical protein